MGYWNLGIIIPRSKLGRALNLLSEGINSYHTTGIHFNENLRCLLLMAYRVATKQNYLSKEKKWKKNFKYQRGLF